MRQLVLGFLAGIWFIDGLALLIAPLTVMARIREALAEQPHFFRWQIVSILAGVCLLFLGRDLSHQAAWIVAGIAMISKGIVLWLGPSSLTSSLTNWFLQREAVDYRFWGLGLCALAMLLLHALGWPVRT